MKLTAIILLAAVLQVSARGYSQKVSLSVKDASLKKVFWQIKKQTGYLFFCNAEWLQKSENVTIQVKEAPLEEVLEIVFRNQPLEYSIVNKTVVLRLKKELSDFKFLPTVYERIIKGKISDEKGQPLAGASVKVKGAGSAGTYTNENGEFFIEVTENAVLEITYVGFESIEVPVKNETKLAIQLKPVNKDMEAVAVVGYGTQKKISVVGAQSSVSVEDLKQPVRNLQNALGGRLSGLVSVQRSGEPGYDDANIWIRGISTFTNNSPLIVIDGVPNSGISGTDPRRISNIDPEDIENFTILKDASATAVYGVRGANGVIIINTKKGRSGKPLITAEANQGVVSFTKLPKFADAPTFMRTYNEALLARGRTPSYTDDQIAKHTSGEDPDLYPNVDWFKEVFNKYGYNRKFNLNVRGGSENAQYYISAGYYSEVGMFKRDNLQSYNSSIRLDRYNYLANFNLKLTKTTQLAFGINGNIINSNYPGVGTSTLFYKAINHPPHIIPPTYSNGQYGQIEGQRGDTDNPYRLLTQSGYNTEFRNEIRSNIQVKQYLDFLLKGLSVSSLFSFDAYNQHNISRSRNIETFIADGRDADGNLVTHKTDNGSNYLSYNRANGGNRRFYTETSVNYNNSFGKHDVTGMLLYNQSDFVDGFAGDLIGAIPFRSRGITGRATYGCDNRYFWEGNFGYTGAENFSPERRYGFFPSVGAAWVVSNEKFYGKFSNIFQFLKLRASYGLVGNSNAGSRFLYISTVDGAGGYSFGDQRQNGFSGWRVGATGGDVSWETAKKADIGLEFKTLNNKLSVVVDLFKERRDDILLQRPDLPSAFGIASPPFANLGITENKGIDASIEYDNSFGELRFGFKGTFTYNRSKVIDDGNVSWKYPYQERKGHKIGQRFGYVSLGLFKDSSEIVKSSLQSGDTRPGDIRYKDINGDGIINGDDQVAIGFGTIPEIVYGMGFSLEYKGFDLSAFFQGTGNVDITFDAVTNGTQPFRSGVIKGNLYSIINDHWTPDNPSQDVFYPRLSTNDVQTTNYYSSTWWMKNGRYLRLKSAELGYTFPAGGLKKFGVKSLRAYVNGFNLLTFSQFKVWDVELGSGQGTRYPNTTTYNVGFRVNFQ